MYTYIYIWIYFSTVFVGNHNSIHIYISIQHCEYIQIHPFAPPGSQHPQQLGGLPPALAALLRPRHVHG